MFFKAIQLIRILRISINTACKTKINHLNTFTLNERKFSFKATTSRVYYGVYYIIIKVNADQNLYWGAIKRIERKCTKI